MAKHRAKVVPIRLGVAQQKPKEIPEYRSEDLQFDWFEAYIPPFPITDAERKLKDLNRAEMTASVEWVKEKTRDLVDEELTRAAAEYPGTNG